MKESIIGGIIIFATALLAQQSVQAQGTITFLSNLDQPSVDSYAVGSNSWLAAGSSTGSNAGGYQLDSIQLGMTDASGNPSGFMAMLYSAVVSTDIHPGNNLATLNGSSNPAASGIYTYTTLSNLTLSPGTIYFIILTAETAVANGAYSWSESTYPSSSNGVSQYTVSVTRSTTII